jgi:hypothetical protein
VLEQSALIVRPESKVAELEAKLGRNPGNSWDSSGLCDSAAEREREAQERAERQARAGGSKRKRAKQGGPKGHRNGALA